MNKTPKQLTKLKTQLKALSRTHPVRASLATTLRLGDQTFNRGHTGDVENMFGLLRFYPDDSIHNIEMKDIHYTMIQIPCVHHFLP